jgi:two-component system sensor histidine kinase MtrB
MERYSVNPDAVGVPTAQVPPTLAHPAPAKPSPLPASQRDQRDQRDVREAWEMALRRKRWVRWFVSWLPHRLTIVIRSLLRLEHLVIAKVRQRWHRSLQLRVVGTTLVISATMIAILGFFLTEQIDDGLLVNAETSARTQVLTALSTARSLPDLTQPPLSGQSATQFMLKLDQLLQPTNGTVSYSVAVRLRADLAKHPGYPPWVTGVNPQASLPSALLDQVQTEQLAVWQGKKVENLLYYAPTTLTPNGQRAGVPAIAFGVPLGNWYQLYFVFPLTDEQQTLQLVQTTLIGVGIALVALLAAIASLVTRWVVLPVRHAARAAQRLSAGQLEERMTVGGADDLAALATSFNDMAASLQEKLH